MLTDPNIGVFARYTCLGRVIAERHTLRNSEKGIGDDHGQAVLAGININYQLG